MIRKLDMIIIDEVSMVRADLMEGIDQILRLTRGQQHLPFGGVKMVLFGDLYQLPPVVRNDVKVYFEDHYGSPYFFSAEVFNNTPLKIIELERVFRQQDLYFKELLDSIRNATITEDQLDTLNERCVWDDLPVEKSGTVHLTTRNDMAEKINAERLAALSRNVYNYAGKITGRFDEKIFPPELNLELKEGAQVMIIRNDPNRRWINGTIGIITDLQKKKVIVASDGKELEVKTSTWENVEYKYDRKAGTIVENVKGTFKQFPLRLAWAFTIHKSQGKTFDKVIVDLGRGAFAHGQTYVALSRCVSLEGITLLNPVKPEDVMVDERITRFLEGNSRVKF